LNKRISEAVKSGRVDDAIKELDEADMEETDKDLALADFRQKYLFSNHCGIRILC
jgi:hypothetical protein